MRVVEFLVRNAVGVAWVIIFLNLLWHDCVRGLRTVVSRCR